MFKVLDKEIEADLNITPGIALTFVKARVNIV
jgi:hypothetical protein